MFSTSLRMEFENVWKYVVYSHKDCAQQEYSATRQRPIGVFVHTECERLVVIQLLGQHEELLLEVCEDEIRRFR